MFSLFLLFICLVGDIFGNSSTNKEAEILYKSDAKVDFYSLARHFVTQKTQTYCGIASAVTVLNAIGVKKVVDPIYYPYPYVTQDNFFTKDVLKFIQPKNVLAKGVTLDQLAAAIETFDVSVKAYHIDESVSYQDFMNIVVGNLREGEDYIIINYERSVLGQEGEGHISPLGAYNKEKDAFLILDVSRYKYSPIWVPSRTLYDAMKEIDPDSGKPRGFLFIKKEPPN